MGGLAPHSTFAPRGKLLPLSPLSHWVQQVRPGLPPPGWRLWGSLRLTRHLLSPQALPGASTPSPDLTSQRRQPKGASHICCCNCGEDGRRAGKFGVSPGPAAPLQFFLSCPFPPPLPGYRLKSPSARSRLGGDAHSLSHLQHSLRLLTPQRLYLGRDTFGPHTHSPRLGPFQFTAPHNPCPPPTFTHLQTLPLVLITSPPAPPHTHISTDPHSLVL